MNLPWPDLNMRLVEMAVPGVSVRRMAQLLGCSRDTVVRKVESLAGIEAQRPLFAESPDEDAVALPAPSVAEDLQADYASVGLTLGAHPMSLLRDRLRKERCLDSEEVMSK